MWAAIPREIEAESPPIPTSSQTAGLSRRKRSARTEFSFYVTWHKRRVTPGFQRKLGDDRGALLTGNWTDWSNLEYSACLEAALGPALNARMLGLWQTSATWRRLPYDGTRAGVGRPQAEQGRNRQGVGDATTVNLESRRERTARAKRTPNSGRGTRSLFPFWPTGRAP